MKVGIQQAEEGVYTCPTGRGRKNTHPAGGDKWGQVPTSRDRRGLIPDRQRWPETHTQHAEANGDTYPTGKDRWGHVPDSQRQMGTQQAEADGGLHPTGGDRWGHILNRQRHKGTRTNRHLTRDMYPTGEDRHSSSRDRHRSPTGARGRWAANTDRQSVRPKQTDT